MKPTRNQELAVLRSVAYASLFDYPLTLAQLHTSLVGERAEPHAIESWWRQSELLQACVEYREGLFFPTGRADLVPLRSRREIVSRDLLAGHRSILRIMSRMPFVRMVALSGSLAHLNAEPSADLDLFVITAPHRVWSVTVTMLVIARLIGCRRRLCVNYVISEEAMVIEPADLFAANQIIHLRPIAGGEMFSQFVDANPFVRHTYPNFDSSQLPPVSDQRSALGDRPSAFSSRLSGLIEGLLSIGVAPLLERAARTVYGWHLRRRASAWRSREQVRLEAECLKLHTTSHRAATLDRYDAAVTAALHDAADRAAQISDFRFQIADLFLQSEI